MNWNLINQQFLDLQVEVSASEVHGHLCGRLVGGHIIMGAGGKRVIEDLLNLDAGQQNDAVDSCLELMQQSDKQLDTSTFGFEMLVPDDDYDLSVRLEGLADWCNGFLQGLGHTLAASELKSNAEMREMLADLADIGNLSLDVEETNENEAYYAELHEYVRIAVMNLYSLFRTKALDEAKGERH
jgi:uncharacterized protein YgfB (UPF0149 family)